MMIPGDHQVNILGLSIKISSYADLEIKFKFSRISCDAHTLLVSLSWKNKNYVDGPFHFIKQNAKLFLKVLTIIGVRIILD